MTNVLVVLMHEIHSAARVFHKRLVMSGSKKGLACVKHGIVDCIWSTAYHAIANHEKSLCGDDSGRHCPSLVKHALTQSF